MTDRYCSAKAHKFAKRQEKECRAGGNEHRSGACAAASEIHRDKKYAECMKKNQIKKK